MMTASLSSSKRTTLTGVLLLRLLRQERGTSSSVVTTAGTTASLSSLSSSSSLCLLLCCRGTGGRHCCCRHYHHHRHRLSAAAAAAAASSTARMITTTATMTTTTIAHHQSHHHQSQHHQQEQQRYRCCRRGVYDRYDHDVRCRRFFHFSPREMDHMTTYHIGRIAQYRLARGNRLNYPECIGLISLQISEAIRDGQYDVSTLMIYGQNLLGIQQCMVGIPSMIKQIQVEGCFPDGTKLLTIHTPIQHEHGNMEAAMAGSYLPIPSIELFNHHHHDHEQQQQDDDDDKYIPGQFIAAAPAPASIANNDNNNNDDDTTTTTTDITLLSHRKRIELDVVNTGDRPIQVGSHYAFIETNKSLLFDRYKSIGMKLDIPSGTSVRFESGEYKRVTLVELGGHRTIIMGNRLTDGTTLTNITNNNNNSNQEQKKDEIMKRVMNGGFKHKEEEQQQQVTTTTEAKPYVMDRKSYIDMYGPTINDRVVLGDTGLIIRIEHDYTTCPPPSSLPLDDASSTSSSTPTTTTNTTTTSSSSSLYYYGDECKFGGGKTIREGMGQSTTACSDTALDVVITNAIIIDAIAGIIKADIGIKGNTIVGIGKAGNPDIMDYIYPNNMIIGTTTDVIAGEKLIVTAGGIDTHVHFICPQQIEEAICSGITTMYGGGIGPSSGTCATTCTTSPHGIEFMLKSTDIYPLNFGFSGKGNTSCKRTMNDVMLAGAAGFKLHEDWGTTPSSINTALEFADEHDIAITIHTDTLNESGYIDDTIAAIDGRTIHTYHTEGAGGGHAPDILRIVNEDYVLPSSTNPTRPFTINTVDEHLDMLMVCHHLDSNIPEDVAFAESRIRSETISAEDILHDMGAISIISSDSQAMGRVGEVITRTWQTASKMKIQRGTIHEDDPTTKDVRKKVGDDNNNNNNDDDNFRVKRYVAKYTINPAIAHGMSQYIGSIEDGKLADLVLWKPSMFGAKPEMIIKGGIISYSQMGDPNASIPTPQPVIMRPMFGSSPTVTSMNSISFVSRASIEDGNNIHEKYSSQLHRKLVPVMNCRHIGKKDMIYNNCQPNISINPETFEVTMPSSSSTTTTTTNNNNNNNVLLRCDPANRVPLAQRYYLF